METLFLGRVVSAEGVSVNPENVEKVKNWPVPKSVKDVEKFLGFLNYHREHIQNYARDTSVLYKLTGSRAIFTWDEEHQKAFEFLKDRMINAPILSYPSANGVFILDTDASGSAIGAVLSQIQNDIEKVISYGSYILTPEQRRYCVTRRELLAIVRFTRQYRHYLLGRQFYIRTDHNSLTWLLRFKYIEGQLARWLEELSQFDIVLLHRSGKKHGNADGMSRIPDEVPFCDCYTAGSDPSSLPCGGCKYCQLAHDQWSRFEDDVDEVVPLAVKTVAISEHGDSWLKEFTKEQLHSAQLSDPCLQKLISWISTGVTPEQNDLALGSPTVKHFYLNKNRLLYQEGLLFYMWKGSICDQKLFIVPESLKQKVMSLNHDLPLTGHMGIAKTITRVKQSFMWYNMAKDIEVFVKSCSLCNRNKKANVKPKAALGQYHAGSPLEPVHIDILGPFTPSSKGNQYVLMIVDQFTKWLECFPLPQQKAEETAKCVVDGFISRFGCPLEIHTDQGKNFDGKLFASVCELLQITKTRSTPYRPCSNGQVECYNRTLLQLIRCFLSGNQKSWDEHLQQLAGAIRSTVNRSTGFTPNMMMLGREVLLPVDLMLGVDKEQLNTNSAEYVERLRKTLQKVHTLARETLLSTQMRQKRDYDLKLKIHSYEIGDLVYRLDTAKKVGFSPKLQQVWKGPLVIAEVISPVLFRIIDRKKSYILHHDRLKPCEDRNTPLWIRRKRNSLLDKADSMEIKDTQSDDDSMNLDVLFEKSDVLHELKTDDLAETPNEISLLHDSSVENIVDAEKSPDVSRAGRNRRKPKHLNDYHI